ncbi:MAG: OmpA family protein [Chitinophagales bacterium]
MKINNILTIALTVVLLSSCAIQKKIKTADQLYKDGSYYNAVELYGEAYEKKQNNTKLTYKIAETNKALKDYKQAEEWYAKTSELNSTKPEAKFFEALMLKNQGKYDEAQVKFDEFVGDYDDKDGTGLKTRAKMELEGIALAKEMMEGKQEVEVETVSGGLNNTLQDFSPKSIGNGKVLMAALLAENAIELETAQAANEDYYSKLYFATNEGGTWKREFLNENINSSNMHVGNGILSRDGNIMYFTKCAEEPAQSMNCNIYKSNKVNGDWGEAEPLSMINKKGANTTHPALAYDALGNEILYFASNRVGSKGGMDIYYAEMNKDGNFSSPVNLGSSVNTKYDDLTPFYDNASGKLFFSSEGYPGMGGLDVFSVEGFGSEYTGAVTNAGYPINSSADDLYLALNDAGTDGYMVSNRVGTTSSRGETCCDDVFKVKLIKEQFLSYTFALEGDETNQAMTGVEAAFYKVNNGDFDFIGNQTTAKEPGSFKLEDGFAYKMNGSKDGYWPSISTIEESEIANMTTDTLTKVFYMKAIDRVKVKNVYFAFDQSDIREMYAVEMDSVLTLMNKYPNVKLKIDGHTDSKGSDAYNQKLSERRTIEAKEYFIEKGIDEARIMTQGFGETNPIAPNENTDGSDNEAGRAKNRRVEFKLQIETEDDMDVKVDYEAQDPKSMD